MREREIERESKEKTLKCVKVKEKKCVNGDGRVCKAEKEEPCVKR